MNEIKRLHPDFQYLIDRLESSYDNYFLTGRAGTGKSTFIRTYLKLTNKKTVLLAPTGVAALNIGGMTIHSFFGFPPSLIKDSEWRKPFRVKLLQAVELIIIDEVSMMRADILDAMDQKLRLFRRQPNLPFGGVQMLLVGDLFQLPPVLPKNEMEILQMLGYESHYFFSARVFQSFGITKFELTEVFRQTNRVFIDLLDRFRRNQLEYDDLEMINARYMAKSEPDKQYITLCARNRTVDEINRKALDNLTGSVSVFQAKLSGKANARSFPAEEVLYLKPEARVMLLRNDVEKRYVNGSLATVKKLYADKIEVQLDDGPEDESITIEIEDWEVLSYKIDNKNKDRFETEVIGTFTQLPVKLAWALTIHKSQGKTFDYVRLDLDGGSFEHGQTYVALSRCTSLEGIVLQRKLTPRDVRVDPRIVNFYEEQF